MIELLAANLHLGKNRMDVFVRDEVGLVREVAVTWRTRLPTNRIPTSWLSLVEQEVRFQQSQEVATKAGRFTF